MNEINDFYDGVTKKFVQPLKVLEIYLITNDGISERHAYTINENTGDKTHTHPEFYKFKWVEQKDFSSLRIQLLSKTKDGNKAVIAIYEDKTMKYSPNVESTFKPTLDWKVL